MVPELSGTFKFGEERSQILELTVLMLFHAFAVKRPADKGVFVGAFFRDTELKGFVVFAALGFVEVPVDEELADSGGWFSERRLGFFRVISFLVFE